MNDADNKLRWIESGVPPAKYDRRLPDSNEELQVYEKGDKQAVILVQCRPIDTVIRNTWTSDSRDHALALEVIAIIRERYASPGKMVFIIIKESQSAFMTLLKDNEIISTLMEKTIEDSESSILAYRSLEAGNEFEMWMAEETKNYAITQQRATGIDQDYSMEKALANMKEALPLGQQTEGHSFVALLDTNGIKIGIIWFGLRSKTRSSFLFRIDIDGDYQGKGFGMLALSTWEHIARNQGAQKLTLNVFHYNVIARNLYVKMGFKLSEVVYRLQ
jgi:ribosomal protein S18 acetylase RimI-like enzyme